MNKLKLSLENCYGIRRLEATFDFSREDRNVAVYASNGTMKSSLAHVFKDAKSGAAPRDRIHDTPGRYRILCDGESIEPDSILVFDPADEKDEVQTSAGILVNDRLRTEYKSIIAGMHDDLGPLVRRLNKLSGVVKNSIPSTILTDFGMGDQPDDSIYQLLLDRAADADEQEGSEDLKDIKYSQVFNGDTKNMLEDPKFKSLIKQYMKRYEKLVSKSKFLKGRFDHHAADGVQDALDKSGFFDAKHTVVFNPKPGKKGDSEEAGTARKYAEIIEKQKEDLKKELDQDWEDMEKMLARTVGLNAFRLLLAENQWLIPLLDDTAALKRRLWSSYLALEQGLAADVCEKYEQGKARLGEIVQEAESERPEWKSIVAEFRRRFYVPFSVGIANQAEALLGIRVPALVFTYEGAGGEEEVERGLLKTTLSDGERRALYILNMLFEVQKQIDSGRETVVVIDDLADSFDYKNKYAIVHYLKEKLDRPGFHMVILTHNFDFLRTIKSRDIVSGNQVFFVDKKANKTTLLPDKIPDNPLDALVGDLAKPTNLIASIAFARNIVEYTGGTKDSRYIELTRLLHWREGTDQATIGALLDILEKTFPKAEVRGEGGVSEGDTVLGTIIDEAERCSQARTEGTLKEKIVLSIATRLLAERFLVNRLLEGCAPPADRKINIHDWIDEHRKALKKRAKDEGRSTNEQEDRELRILDDVALMTPEAIHINSFMYEPILDMPSRHLSDLYRSVRELGGETDGT